MAFDGTILHLVAQSLRPYIGARVQKIYQPMKDTVIISLKSKDASGRLIISASAGLQRIHITQSSVENPASPPMFCMLLRKHLSSAMLTDIYQLGMDRVIFLKFDSITEMGDHADIIVVFEMLGRQSNILLCRAEEDKLKILDCLRRTDAASKRVLLPGVFYEPPESSGRINILQLSAEDTAEKIVSSARPAESALRDVADGFSPIVAREFAFRCKDNTTNFISVKAEIEKLKSCIESGGQPVMLYDENDIPFDFTFFIPKQYGNSVKYKTFDSYNSLLDEYFTERDVKQKQRELSSKLIKHVTNLAQRAERKLHAREADFIKSKKREHLRIYGELICAGMHNISPGASFFDTEDYYNDMRPIRVPLDPALSAAGNAQKYFKEYKKAASAEKMLSTLIEQNKDECRYLNSVLYSLSRSESANEIDSIYAELVEEGYIKRKSNSKSKPQALKPLLFTSSDGFKITVGRNNRQNDVLTLKTADKNDIWLHVKDAPGSHVIIEAGGADVPDSTIMEAAVIACTYSSAAMSANVPVDYTQVRNVKKPAGAKPGMVIYKTNRTVYATPSKDLCNRLQVK